MRRLLFMFGIFIAGAVVLAPAIAFIGLDPLPGDFAIHLGSLNITVPVTYSLCASLDLGLFYYLMKR
jgi:hypothetical protein